MKRREFISLLGGAAGVWPLAARAQQGERVRRIAVLSSGAIDDPLIQTRVEAFRQGLQHLGWTDGRNVRIEARGAAAMDRLSSTQGRERPMRQIISGAFVGCLWASMARADITAFMQEWDVLPQVQITQGRAGNCEANRSVFGPAQMAKGFRQTYPGTGSQGEDICWRRTADPFNSASGWSIWTRCSSDGDCEIR